MTLFTDLRGPLLLQHVVRLCNTSCVQLCFGIGVIDVRVIYYLILDLSRDCCGMDVVAQNTAGGLVLREAIHLWMPSST